MNDAYYNQGVDMLNTLGDLQQEQMEASAKRSRPYTPGPWRHRNGSIEHAEYSVTIATVNHGISAQMRAWYDGNCEAIAAVPELIEVLTELCQLKKYKEVMGKDSLYLERQPLAWQKAYELLNRLL